MVSVKIVSYAAMVSHSDVVAFADFNYTEEGRNAYPFFPFLL